MGAKPEKPSLGLLGRLGFLPLLVAVLGKSIFATVTGVFVSKKYRPDNYFKWVMYSTFRTFIALQSGAQEQFNAPLTGNVYKQFCKAKKIEPVTETLSDGTKLHWLGSKDATTVQLYYHGGGYNLTANPVHFDYLYDHLQYLNGKGSPSATVPRSYAVAFLEYDVAPYAIYPRQLAQAVLALNHLLQSRSPSNILIGGDSAGGHLAVDVLAHILHPHPDRSVAEIKLPEGQKLKAAILISPWVEQSTHAESYRNNAWKDLLPSQWLDRSRINYLGGAPRDPYNAPLTAPRGFWKGLSGVVERVYISGGSDEVLIDDIEKFRDILQSEWEGPAENLKTVIVKGDPHDAILCVRMLGYAAKDVEIDGVVKGWLEEAVPT